MCRTVLGFGSVCVLSSINFDVKVVPAHMLYKSITTEFPVYLIYCASGRSTISAPRKLSLTRGCRIPHPDTNRCISDTYHEAEGGLNPLVARTRIGTVSGNCRNCGNPQGQKGAKKPKKSGFCRGKQAVGRKGDRTGIETLTSMAMRNLDKCRSRPG